jgi:hypothetical protein
LQKIRCTLVYRRKYYAICPSFLLFEMLKNVKTKNFLAAHSHHKHVGDETIIEPSEEISLDAMPGIIETILQ